MNEVTYRLSTPDCPGARRKLGKLKMARRTSAVISTKRVNKLFNIVRSKAIYLS